MQRNENVVPVYNIGNVNGEMTLALALGEVKSGQVTRSDHRGTPVRVESPLSTKRVDE